MTATVPPLVPSSSEVQTHAFWIVAPRRAEIRASTLPSLGEDEVRVRTMFSGISRGTESLVFRGGVPHSEHERMRGPHQEGSLALPVKYGYALVGEIEVGPRAGEKVLCLHPHQTIAQVQSAGAHRIPADVPPQRAVLAPNLETAINATWDAGVGVGDRVVIVGAGVVGCLIGYLCARIPGCSVQLVDLDTRREATATKLGCQFAPPSNVWSNADVVFHTSASASGLQTALDAAGSHARVVELSWYGDTVIEVSLGGAFHPRRLQLSSSQVGAIPPTHAPRWSFARRLGLALSLLSDATLDALICSESAFGDLPTTMARLAEPQPDHDPIFCHRVHY